jgi:hypothetical protein
MLIRRVDRGQRAFGARYKLPQRMKLEGWNLAFQPTQWWIIYPHDTNGTDVPLILRILPALDQYNFAWTIYPDSFGKPAPESYLVEGKTPTKWEAQKAAHEAATDGTVDAARRRRALARTEW